ncbi:CCHC-type domain-containing protein [Trichonephila clavipes]|nr:CCHC-type domain-containing protein [Trichonephila clavipes]
MIIGDVIEEKWQIALAAQNSDTVEELVDRATSLDAIRSVKQENKKQSSRPQLRSFSTHDIHLHKYYPTTDNIQDINCWRCGRKGHASFMCHLPPPPRGSSVVRPSQFQEPSSQANAPLLSSSGSINHGNNTHRVTTNLNSSDSRRNNNSNRNSTSGRYATTNPKDVVLPDLNTKILPSQAQLIPKFAKLSTIQQAHLNASNASQVIGKFSDVFYSDDDNIGLCSYIEFKIDLQHDKPIRYRPYRLPEPDH